MRTTVVGIHVSVHWMIWIIVEFKEQLIVMLECLMFIRIIVPTTLPYLWRCWINLGLRFQEVHRKLSIFVWRTLMKRIWWELKMIDINLTFIVEDWLKVWKYLKMFWRGFKKKINLHRKIRKKIKISSLL